MKKEEEDSHPQCSEGNKSFSRVSSEFPSPKVNVTSWLEQEEKPPVPGHPRLEENGVASNNSTGLPDVIIKVEQEEEQEEEPGFSEYHQEWEGKESIAVAVSGSGLSSKNLHLCVSEEVGPNGTSLRRVKGLISKCYEKGEMLEDQDGVEREPRIHPAMLVGKIPLWGEDDTTCDGSNLRPDPLAQNLTPKN
ncbi:UNVERIFIED_CONTAM: hypothetical protein K2H54_061284 [Gekko kuhli]